MSEHAQDAINAAVDVWSGPRTYAKARCRYCGEHRVSWRRTDTGWRLHDQAGDPHRCAAYLMRDSKDATP